MYFLKNKKADFKFFFLRLVGNNFEGSIGGIFNTMSKIMNFTYSSIPSIDGFYGAKVRACFTNKLCNPFYKSFQTF